MQPDIVRSFRYRAAEDPSSAVKSRLRSLLREDPPDAGEYFEIDGLKLLRNPSPILRYVAAGEDESLWRTMERTEGQLGAAKQHRISVMVGDGTSVVAGPTKNKDASDLKNFVVAQLKNVRKWNTVIEKVWDAIAWGHRPLKMIWNPTMKWRGKEYWGVTDIREKSPENYTFTTDGLLVRKPYSGDQSYRVKNAGQNKFQWMLASSGGCDTPFGVPWYESIYLAHFIKGQFLQMFSQGMERSMGVIKVTQGAGAPQAKDSKAMQQIVDDVMEMVDLLAKNNILISNGDIALELATQINYSDGWLKALEYFDKIITLLMLGENLSMYVGSKGSYGAADAHIEGPLKQLARRDARSVSAVINEYLIEPLVTLNWGPVDSDIMPRLRFEIEQEMNLEATRMLYDFGATIDGSAMARRFGVPVLKDGEHSDDGEIPLKKPDPMEMAALKAESAIGGGGKTGPLPTKPIDKRNEKKAEGDQKMSRAESSAEEPLMRFWDSIKESYLEGRDPFAQALRED